jgi:outer membrane immunogenic protein
MKLLTILEISREIVMSRLTIAIATAAAAIALGAIQSASAADLPRKAPPMAVAAPVGWTGWYGGVNIGGGATDGRFTNAPAGCFLTSVTCGLGPAVNLNRTVIGDLDGGFFTGGVQAGYNWQFNQWLLGLEADINAVSRHSGRTDVLAVTPPLVGTITTSTTANLEWLGTFRGRIGWLYQPSLLLYATGGLAYGGTRSAAAVSFSATADTYAGAISSTRTGWTAGAGAEWLVANGWSVKVEYLYVDLGSTSFTDACTNLPVCGSPPQVAPGAAYSTRVDFRDHIGRIGLNYHFSPTLR